MPGASNGISLQKLKNRNANIHTASDGRPTPNTCAWTVNAPSSGMNQKTKMPSRAGRFEKSMDTKDLFSAEKPGPINFTIDYNNWAAEDPNQNDLKISPPFGASIERPKSAPATKWINKDSPVHMPGIIMSTTELNGDVVSQKFHSSQSPIMFNHQRPKSGGPLLKANFPYHARISPTGAVNPNRMEEMYSRGDIAVSIEERLSSLISPSAGIPDQLQIPNNCDDDYLLPLKKEINVPSDDSVFYDNDAFDGSFYKGELKPLGANYIPSKPSEKKAGPRADVFLNHAHQPYPSSQHATPPPYRVLPSYQASLHKNIHGRYNGPENPQQLFHKATQPSLLRSPQRETRLSLQSSNNRPNPVGESSPSSQNSSFISNRAESYISYRKPGSVTLQPVEIRNTHFPNQNLSFADSYRNSNYGIGIRLYPDLPFTNSNSATNSQIRDPNSLLMDDFPGAYYSSELDALHERNNQIIEQNKRINNIASNDTIYPLETNTVAVERRDITHNINMPSSDNCDFDDGKSLSSADTDSSDTDIPKLGDPFADLALELSHAIDSDMESNRTITPPLPPLSPTTSESVTVSSPHHRDKAFMAAKRDSLKSKTSQNISPQTSPEFDVRRKKKKVPTATLR